VVLSDHMRKNKAEGKLMTKPEKIELSSIGNWRTRWCWKMEDSVNPN
jgi:hypothetical protein